MKHDGPRVMVMVRSAEGFVLLAHRGALRCLLAETPAANRLSA